MLFEDFVKLKYYNKIFYLLQHNLIGKLIKKGKKFYALKIFYKLKYLLKKKTKKDSNLILLISVFNSLIKVNFIKLRLGGTKKEIPVFLKFERQIKFAINELITNSQTKHRKSINLIKLVKLLCFSYKLKGPIIKKNYQMYKKAIDNRVLLSFIKR